MSVIANHNFKTGTRFYAFINNLNLRINSASLSRLDRMQRNMSGLCAKYMWPKAKHIPLHPHQPLQARFHADTQILLDSPAVHCVQFIMFLCQVGDLLLADLHECRHLDQLQVIKGKQKFKVCPFCIFKFVLWIT